MVSSLKRHGSTIVVAAIVGAVAAGSPAIAAEVVAFAKSAGNANTVNKIGASKTPRAGMLLPLNAKGQFPSGVIPTSRAAIGKAGPAGPQGLQGPQGAVGPAGAKGASGSQGATGSQGAKGDKGDAGGLVLSSLVDIDPKGRAADENLWGDVVVNGGEWNSAFRGSYPLGDQTSFLEWEVPLAAGTWALDVTYAKSPDAGKLTFSLADVVPIPIGTIDSYNASILLDQRDTTLTVTVPTSGMHTLRVETADKSVDSSGYYGYLHWLRLVKQ